MKPLDLNDAKRAAIQALKTTDAVNRVLEACSKASLRYCRIDIANVRNKTQLLDAFAEALVFPDYFGHNWDALYDVLCDEQWLGEHGIVLHLKNTATFERQAADDWLTLSEIFEETIDFWRATGIPFWVFVDHTREHRA